MWLILIIDYGTIVHLEVQLQELAMKKSSFDSGLGIDIKFWPLISMQ